MWIALTGTFLTCVSTLIGVVLGAKLSHYSSSLLDSKHLLTDFYSEVLGDYMYFVWKKDDESMSRLLSRIERARLYCSDECEEILKSLVIAITEDTISPKKCGALLDAFRISAKDDLKKYDLRRKRWKL